jgi:hypothetical protein
VRILVRSPYRCSSERQSVGLRSQRPAVRARPAIPLKKAKDTVLIVVRHEVALDEWSTSAQRKEEPSRSATQARVSSPVPNPDVRCWQRQGAKLGIPPKGRASHPHNPGQGKIGLVNASERSTRLRKYRLPEWWLTTTAMLGHGAGTDSCPAGRHPTPEYRARLLQSQLTSVERGNPNGV